MLNDDEFKQRVAAARPAARERQQRRVRTRPRRGVREALRHRRRRRLAAAALAGAREERQPRRVVPDRSARRPPAGADARGAEGAAGTAAAAQARRQALNGIEANWTTDRSNYDRCISLGLQGSLTPKIYNSGNRIVQGPGWLAFSNEMIHETRVIPTDGRKNVGAGIKSWMGNSVGHWEGDTLVVETRNLNSQSLIQNAVLSDAGVVIERFTLADANTLDYRMTVNDPKSFTAPWTMRMPIPREDDYGFFEYGCHEGNYAMVNLLSGSRAEEKRRAAAAARGEAVPSAAPAGGGRGGRGGGGGGRGGAGAAVGLRAKAQGRRAGPGIRRRACALTSPWALGLRPWAYRITNGGVSSYDGTSASSSVGWF